MIKKSLEAYFFTLNNKIVFCKKQFQMKSCYLLSIWNIFHIVKCKKY